MANRLGTVSDINHTADLGYGCEGSSTVRSTGSLVSTDHGQQTPLIEISESDGTFNVYADFRSVPGASDGAGIAVEFAQQGVILTSNKVQRYLPIPTDAQVAHAKVTIADGIVRLAVPTADLGHRWRSIIMW